MALILDLAGYTPDRDLGSLQLLEPACGDGAFLAPAVERLMRSARTTGREPSSLGDAITAYDVDTKKVGRARRSVEEVLRAHDVPDREARALARCWIRPADFLLSKPRRAFDVVVGNPPYVRIEQLPAALRARYRQRFATLFDRADLYVAFIERALDLLAPEGVLSFICADRWTTNRYGGPLRRLITERFALSAYVDVDAASPFESEVCAYPAVFAVRRARPGAVSVGRLTTASTEERAALVHAVRTGSAADPDADVTVHPRWFEGDEPWVIRSPRQLSLLRSLEERLPQIESDGRTRVRIGVATGDDRTYVVGTDADVEPDRLVPLVMRQDIADGRVADARRFVINPFDTDGHVVDLRAYPRLARYLRRHEARIRRRHVARRSPASWFRTIDRVYPELVRTPKLLIPDIAGTNDVVYEEGRFLPHHNLYFVTSDVWDPEVLGGLLASRVALFFVWSYAVRMRGGHLRFQAQYLRRIRLPRPGDVPQRLARSIRTAFRRRAFADLDNLATRAYGLDGLPDFDYPDRRAGSAA